MKRISRKIATAIIAVSLTTTAFVSMPNVKADDIGGVTAGVSAALSYNLMMNVASVKANNYTTVSAINDSKEESEGVDEKLIGTDDEGNETICGYTNLGISQVDGNLNVRKEPSKSGTIIGKMTNNCGCEVLESKDGWIRIKSGNVKGWVSAEYLLVGDDALAIVNDAASLMAKVTTDTLRVRKKPSTDSTVLTTVAKGESLEVVEELDGWVKIELDSDEGYISTEYVKLSYSLKEANTLSELNFGNGVSNTRVSLVQFALKYVGGRYVWGGTSLQHGVDCSGFTMRVYQNFGYNLPHYSGSQAQCGTRVSASEAKPGDLFFYGNGSRISHVAIYIGNGQIVHASSPRTGIKISNAFYRTPIKIVRIINN